MDPKIRYWETLIVPQRKQLLPGQSKAGFQFFQQRTRIIYGSGTAKLLKLLSNFHHALGAQIQTHAFESMSVESQLRGIFNGLADLGNPRRSALQKEIHQFLKH